MATRSKPRTLLPDSILLQLEARRSGLARHMARAVVTLVRWDASTGAPPQREAIQRTCEAGLDLFFATAREARPATSEELRRVAQLGVLQARSSQSVEPVLAAYRVAARVAWNAILRAWRQHPEAAADTLVATADYVFSALDQVASDVTRTYLAAREQHMLRGTRARDRLVHALISDTFDSELALQRQALALSLAIAPTYVAAICRLLVGKAESERGGELLAEAISGLDLPPRTLVHTPHPQTVAVLWPAESAAACEEVHDLTRQMQKSIEDRLGRGRARIRAGLGGYHPGLHGISRSYLEAQQAIDVGRKLEPLGEVHHYEEVLPYLVLTQNPLLADRYVRHHLERLTRADEKGKGSLMETLEAYMAKGSIKETALALGLHRHSVIYRIDKIRELLDADMDDPADRVRLQLAIDLRGLL